MGPAKVITSIPCLGPAVIIREALGLGGICPLLRDHLQPVWWYKPVISGAPKLKARLGYILRAYFQKQKTAETLLELFLGP